MKKKLISLLIALVVSLCAFRVSAQAAPDYPAFEFTSPDFIERTTGMINSNWDDSYFSVISLTIGESVMSIDGEEVAIAPVTIDDGGEISLPVEIFTEVIGAKAEIDPSTQDVTVTYNGKNTVLSNRTADFAVMVPVKTTMTAAFERIKIFDSEDGKVTSKPAPGQQALSVKQLSITAAEAERIFCLEVTVNGDRVTITRPYQTKDIILKTKNGQTLRNTFGAVDYAADNMGTYFLQYKTEEETRQAYEKYLQYSGLEYVTLNKVVKAESLSWGTDRIAANQFKAYLQEIGKDKDELLVAVADTGVDMSHPFFENRLRTDLAWDFIDNDSVAEDVYGHGTHVSGTIVDCTPDNVKIIPVKVLGDDGYSTQLSVYYGIMYAADMGAKVINLSLGGYDPNPNNMDSQAIDYALSKGALSIVAAGNESSDTENYSPANAKNAITVAAVDENDLQAGFSNFGDEVDISAPGVSIYSTYPNNEYIYMNGTSMATPHIVAATAMLLLDKPELTFDEMKRALQDTAVDVGTSGWDRIYGAGILDFRVFFGEKIEAESLELSVESIETVYSVALGNVFTLNATIFPVDATDKSVSYASSDESVAVYRDGKIHITGIGQAVITVSLKNGVSRTCDINVTQSNYWIEYASDSYDGGTGTESDPYLIASAEQLAKLLFDVNTKVFDSTHDLYFKQTADVDLAGKEWFPISYRYVTNGTWVSGINLNFDGGGYSIKNLYIENKRDYRTDFCMGLFGYVTGGVLKNIHLVDAKITGNDRVGGIAGYVISAKVYNCSVNGEISGNNTVGGLVGYCVSIETSNSIANCSSDATVTGDIYIGGLVGSLKSSVYNSYFVGETSEYSTMSGGIAGSFEDAVYVYLNNNDVAQTNTPKIVNCFSSDTFIGHRVGGEIIRSYYMSGDNPIRFDDYPDNTDLQYKPQSFFTEKEQYLSSDNWYRYIPWDFEMSWDITDGALPRQRVYSSASSRSGDYIIQEMGSVVHILGYTGISAEVIIPETINGKPVRFINNEAFYGNVNLTDITLPSGVMEIGVQAFDSCVNLTSINVNPANEFYSSYDGVLYDKNMETLFMFPFGKNATVFEIPETVAKVEQYSFYGCTGISKIIVPGKVKTIAYSAFDNCANLSEAVFTGDAPELLGNYVFYGTHQDFTVYYYEYNYGFSTPEWYGYNSRPIIIGEISATPPSGLYESGTLVTLSTTRDGAAIYYTTDDTDPNEFGILYSSPIVIASDVVIKAVTVKEGEPNGDVAAFKYKIDDAIVFSDANLDAAVRREMNKPVGNILRSEVEMITSLNLGSSNIENISGLDAFINLDYLSLYNNGISDISILSKLTNLTNVELSYNSIVDLEPLSGLKRLESLLVRGNRIVDVNPIAELTNLRSLYLHNNQIKNITAVEGLIHLTLLDLSNNEIADISPIANLKNLVALRIEHNYIDISDSSPAMVIINEMLSNGVDVIYTTQHPPVMDIDATPPSGLHERGTLVTLSTTRDGAAIYYTSDGSDPNEFGILYSSPIVITSDIVINAVTVKVGEKNGNVATFMYSVLLTVPSVPVSLTAVSGDGQVTISWTAPADDGGSAIIEYQVSNDGGLTWVSASSSESHTFTGLVNSTNYLFKVRAVNSVGSSEAAEISAVPEAAIVMGGVNGDKVITIADVMLIYRHFRGTSVLTGNELLAADVNADGDITIADVMPVYLYFRGKITSFHQ